MGILHSTSRNFGCKPEDEPGERPIYPYLLHQRQNHCNPSGDSSVRLPKILIFGSSIYNAVKGLLRSLRFVFCFPRPRKTADPVLPIQNPESSISSEPLIVKTTLISSPTNDSSAESIPEIAPTIFPSNTDDEEELQCESVEVLSCQQWRPEENDSANGKQTDSVIVSIPEFTCSLAYASVSEEIISSAVVIGENVPRNVPVVVESMGMNSTIGREEKREEEKKVKIEKRGGLSIIAGEDGREEKREEEKKVKIEKRGGLSIIAGEDGREEKREEEKKVKIEKRGGLSIIAGEDGKEEKREEVKKVKIKNIIVVREERWIKHYSSHHRILLVGDGDFSFSASLAVAFGSASNIIATSLDSEAFLKKNYRRASSNIEKLRSRESKVMHEIDATKMANHSLLAHLKFDRIIYNFPYAGLNNLKNLPRETQLRRHRRLVSLFLKNAREMISTNGEIHISHKTNAFHLEFKLEHVASSHRLRLIEAVNFDCDDYPGYKTKYGFGGDNNFNCNPSKTYKFGLKKVQYYHV